MREILFRGKRTDNGEWVVSDSIIHFEHIIDRTNCYQLWERENGWVDVDPETVGQFTGLCDKNGNRIFEGDIVKERGDAARTRYEIRWNEAGFEQKDIELRYGCLLERGDDLEVIGNIHDNPELLKRR